MANEGIFIERIDQPPEAFLKSIGHIFKVFDHRTQDSGNISYGIQIDRTRYFVKTAGKLSGGNPSFSHPERLALLRNAALVRQSIRHPALPALYLTIESPEGPLLVYEWVEGALLREALECVRQLPASDIINLLDQIYELHRQLVRTGWVALDFYDGCMIYDIESRCVRVVDLDHYHRGPFTNKTGRLPGSSRFMAPEETECGALIDERTTVFTMGRTAAVLLSDNTLERRAFRGGDEQYEVMCRACRVKPDDRFDSMGKFYAAWQNACSATAS